MEDDRRPVSWRNASFLLSRKSSDYHTSCGKKTEKKKKKKKVERLQREEPTEENHIFRFFLLLFLPWPQKRKREISSAAIIATTTTIIIINLTQCSTTTHLVYVHHFQKKKGQKPIPFSFFVCIAFSLAFYIKERRTQRRLHRRKKIKNKRRSLTFCDYSFLLMEKKKRYLLK